MPPKAPGFARWSNACFVSGETSRIFASSTYPYRFLGRDAGKPLWCGAVKKRKLGICGGTVLCKPKNGSPFRNLNRRGGSLPRPPLVSVDSRGSLRPKGRSCHWQAGRFAPPSKKAVWIGQKQAVYLHLRQQRLAKKTILLTVISASSLLEMCFFTAPPIAPHYFFSVVTPP